MQTQLIIVLSSLAAFTLLGFFFYRSIKNLETKNKNGSKKKGRTKYMPQVKDKFN